LTHPEGPKRQYECSNKPSLTDGIGFQIHQFIKSYWTTIVINYLQGIAMKINKLMFAPALLILSGVVNAESFNYDYIDTNIIRYDLESSTSKSHYDGYLVSVSKSVSEYVHLLGAYTDIERGNGLTLDFKSIGVGINYPIYKGTDIVVNYLHNKWNESSTSGIFNSIEFGIRNQFSDDLELNSSLGRHDFAGRSILFKAFSIGAIYKINNDLSLKFKAFRARDSASNTVDWDGREIGIRYYF